MTSKGGSSRDLFDKLTTDFVADEYDSYNYEYILHELFEDLEYEYELLDDNGCCIDLSSSKYQMIEAQEYQKACDWYETLTDEEKNHVDILKESMTPTAG